MVKSFIKLFLSLKVKLSTYILDVLLKIYTFIQNQLLFYFYMILFGIIK